MHQDDEVRQDIDKPPLPDGLRKIPYTQGANIPLSMAGTAFGNGNESDEKRFFENFAKFIEKRDKENVVS